MGSTNKHGKAAGIRDIAEALGTSIGTVDRALHGRSGVSARTKARVLRMAEQLGYKPNIAARSLKPLTSVRCPTDSGGCQSSRKCRPSIERSVVTASSSPAPGRNSAQSSPIPSRTVPADRRADCAASTARARIVRNSPSSPSKAGRRSAASRFSRGEIRFAFDVFKCTFSAAYSA